MPAARQSLRRALIAALAATAVAVGLLTLLAGFSGDWLVRLVQAIVLFGLGTAVIGGVVALGLLGLGGWRDPQSDAEFDQLVERSERLAAEDPWAELDEHWDTPDPEDDDLFDPEDEDDFKALVRAALDELPLEFHRALEHVAVVVSDHGGTALPGRRGRRGAYGLYQGDTVARDHFHDRILIFRDTLVRDFGHDPELLRAQVTRTVRHELAHHLGWDERGVRDLGL